MRRESNWRTRDNPLHLDLFECSSQSLSSSPSSSTLDMALNDEENVRRHLSDYARLVLQGLVTRIHAPLARNVNFRIDSHVMSMLPIFHGKPSEDPYRHVDELSQVCEINQIHNVSADIMKMKLFPATLRDRAKDWFLKLGKEFTSWTEMEEEFPRKYYSVEKTTSVRKAMREFTQGLRETFHEAWERLRDVTRECPHHVVSNHELTQIFYGGLGPQDRYLLDAASGGTFMSKFEDEAMELIKTVAENSHHNSAKPFRRGAMPKAGLIDAKSIRDGHAPRKDRQDGGGSESTFRSVPHPPQIIRTCTRSATRSVTMHPLLTPQPRRDRLSYHGNSRAGHASTRPRRRANSTRTNELSRYIVKLC